MARTQSSHFTPISQTLHWLKSNLQHNLAWRDTDITQSVHPAINMARQAILNGECAPSIRQLQKNFGLSRNKARACLQQLAQQGYLSHDKNRHEYHLLEKDTGIQAGFNKFVRKFAG